MQGTIMKSKLMSALALAALLVGLSGPAAATEGWYARADVGYSVGGALEVNDTDLDFDDDWSQHLGLGYAFANNFRLEGEFAHRANDFSDFDGDVTAWALMANLYYDFNRGGRFEPYVGLGVGGAQIETGGVIGPISFDDDDTVFAYQAMIGVAIGLSQQWDLDLGYKYFVAPDVGVDGIFDIETPEPISFDGDYEHQAVTLGLRYQFASPAPAPAPYTPPPAVVTPPAPVACPASSFVVYFEWDRSNLNQAAQDTINAAVQRARECNLSNAVVVGHTDTSGSAAYNVGLSERRAGVVRDALVAGGLSAGAITTQARGETDLATPTRDGVREPLNRRTAVTITFR
jgi:outer membrane protein OmpA-like peptidoglycan-associated protein